MPWVAWAAARQVELLRVLQVSPLLPRPVPVWCRPFAFRWPAAGRVPLFVFRSPAAVRQVTRQPVLQWRWAWSLARNAFSPPLGVPEWGAVEGAPPDGRSRVAKVRPPAWRTTESDSTNRMRLRSRAGHAIRATGRILAQSGASTRALARRRWLCSREGRCRIKFGMRKRFVRQRASRQTRPQERARSAKRDAAGPQRTSLQSTEQPLVAAVFGGGFNGSRSLQSTDTTTE